MLARLLPLFRLGLGARLGAGTQVMSWVALADWVRAARFLLDQPEISGPVNLTAPNPETNAAFTAALAGALHRPALLSVPSPVLSVALGGVTSDLMSSARVLPRRAQRGRVRVHLPGPGRALAAELRMAGSRVVPGAREMAARGRGRAQPGDRHPAAAAAASRVTRIRPRVTRRRGTR